MTATPLTSGTGTDFRALQQIRANALNRCIEHAGNMIQEREICPQIMTGFMDSISLILMTERHLGESEQGLKLLADTVEYAKASQAFKAIHGLTASTALHLAQGLPPELPHLDAPVLKVKNALTELLLAQLKKFSTLPKLSVAES